MKIKKRVTVKVKYRQHAKHGGRKKRTSNHLSHEQAKSIKQNFIDVFEMLGGKEGFFKFVKSSTTNKRMFYGLYAKMLPKEVVVQGPEENPQLLPFVVEVEGEKPNASS